MRTKSHFFIFSVFNNKNLDKSLQDHAEVKDYLNILGLGFQEVEGSYKGIRERAFMVVGRIHEPLIRRLTKLYKQESYLSVYGDDFAELIYLSNNDTQGLGYLVEISKEEAHKTDSWTFVPNLGAYYTTKK